MGTERREALRRRLYAPGASEADVAAYRAGMRRGRGAPRPRGPAVPRRLRRALPAAGLLLAAVAVGVVLPPRPPAPPAAPLLPLTAEDRAELRANLARGGAAGIAAYLVTHPSPPGIPDATRFTTEEVHGVGRATVRLDGAGDAGRATVLLVLAGDGRATWTATPGTVRVQDGPGGSLTATTFRYAAGRGPARLLVEAPGGMAWGAAVVRSD